MRINYELIVFLVRECHWTFDYTLEFLDKTPVGKLSAFLTELKYQKSVDEYIQASHSAMIICTWANAQKKGNHFRATDFIGQPPQRANAKAKLTKAAKDKGIKLPTGGIDG